VAGVRKVDVVGLASLVWEVVVVASLSTVAERGEGVIVDVRWRKVVGTKEVVDVVKVERRRVASGENLMINSVCYFELLTKVKMYVTI